MRYSELDKLAEENEWEKTRDDDYWLLYIKDNINIEICKHRIDNDILLWAETSEGEINLNDELDFINACIELGNTPLADRESEQKMRYREFIDIVKCVINNNWEYCDIDKEDEDVKLVESVTTHNFEHWETEQIYFYILGMRDLHEISNEEWRYFTEAEE